MKRRLGEKPGRRAAAPLGALALLVVVATAAWAQGEQAEKDFAFAQGLYRQENYALAAEKLAAFVKQYPNHANLSLALFLTGECLFRTGKYPEAEPYFVRLTTQLPNSQEAEVGWVWLGDTRFQAQRYAEAATAYATYLQKYPQGAQTGRTSYWLGESYYQLGKYPEAAAAYQQALAGKLSEQEAAYARYALGWTYLQLNDPEKAIGYLQQVVDKYAASPVAVESQYLLGTAYRLRKNYPTALGAFQKVLAKYAASPFAARAQMGVAWCHFDQQAYEQALEAFLRVTTSYPGTEQAAEARLRAADCQFHLGRYAAAASSYEPVAADTQGKWADEAAYWLAISYEQVPDVPKAIAAHSRLTTQFKQSSHVADSYLHLARLYLAAGQTDLSISSYQAAAEAAKQPAVKQQALAELAWARYVKSKSEASLAEVEALVKQTPTASWAEELAYQVASARFAAGACEPALGMLQLMAVNQPQGARRTEAAYLRGACLEKQGKPAEAEEQYRLVVQDRKKTSYAGLAAAALVNLYAKRGDLDQARKTANDLQKTEAGAEAKAFALHALGEALYQAKLYPEAMQTYGKILSGMPDSAAAPYALLGQAWVKLATGDAGAGEAFLTVARKYPQSPCVQRVPAGLLAIGEKLFTDGKYAEAQAAYQRLLDNCPQSDLVDEAQYKLAWSLLKQNRGDLALAAFTQAAARADAPAVAADARYQAAKLLMAKGSVSEAAALLEPFREKYGDTEVAPAALVLWGRALTELKQYEPAGAALQLALTRYPQHAAAAEAWLVLAQVYRRQGKAEPARQALEKALATAQGAVGAEAQFEFSALLREQGNDRRAAEEFLKVAILYGDEAWSARAQYEAGQCYERLQDKESAVRCYRVIGRDYPKQQTWVEQAQARLKALGAT